MAGVSYVVTVYNKAPYLAGMLDALAGQAGDFEREFVFVDDGSTDASLELLRSLTAGWPDVTVLTRANAGPSVATNAGFARARLSCHSFRNNEVRLQLHALAYNLGNFLRTPALPEAFEHWSLTTLREKPIKIGTKVLRHGRYIAFQLGPGRNPEKPVRQHPAPD